MDAAEIQAIVDSYIRYNSVPYTWTHDGILQKRDRSEDEWVLCKISDILDDKPEILWEIILKILAKKPENSVLEVLAAGPLEELLAKYGYEYIARVEAETMKNREFKHLLGGVWKNDMEDEIWARVQNVWDRSNWD